MGRGGKLILDGTVERWDQGKVWLPSHWKGDSSFFFFQFVVEKIA